MTSFAESVAHAVLRVTKPWAEIKKQQDREQRQAAAYRRDRYFTGSLRVTIRDVAFQVIPQAYQKASGNGQYPATARQIMYAARPAIQQKTGRRLDDQYFTQTLLPDYIREHSEAEKWDVVYDARGHLQEPHTGRIIGLGTSEVRNYLVGSADEPLAGIDLPAYAYNEKDIKGPGRRYGALLYIEKEGFLELLKSAGIPKRYDLAVASSKGMSSTATRELIEGLSGRVKILVLHDFDKAGFSILGTLQRDTRRYSFGSPPEIVDLGLRLEDVKKWKLETEQAYHQGRFPQRNLRENGATEEEIEFLLHERVELNAFTSEDFVTWLEEKLDDQGVEKVIPDDALLNKVHRRIKSLELWRKFFEEHRKDVEAKIKKPKVPKNLRKRVKKYVDDNPEVPWDIALTELELEEPKARKRRHKRL